jgi:hypothetical protein
MRRFWRWLNEPLPPWEDRHAAPGIPLEEFPPPPPEWRVGYEGEEERPDGTVRERSDKTGREV